MLEVEHKRSRVHPKLTTIVVTMITKATIKLLLEIKLAIGMKYRSSWVKDHLGRQFSASIIKGKKLLH